MYFLSMFHVHCFCSIFSTFKKETGLVMVAAGPLGCQKWFPAVKFGTARTKFGQGRTTFGNQKHSWARGSNFGSQKHSWARGSIFGSQKHSWARGSNFGNQNLSRKRPISGVTGHYSTTHYLPLPELHHRVEPLEVSLNLFWC